MLAFSTSHVVAATILFDCRDTLRTLFRIGRYPIRGLRIIFAFLDPFLYQSARRGLMIIRHTPEAEMVFASAFDSRYNHIEISLFCSTLDRIHTVGRRTPFDIIFVINIGAS